MKATGIVRRIDDLGRVVIPKEIRRTMRIREGDPLEIYTSREGEVIFKKYSLLGGVEDFAAELCETMSRSTGSVCAVTDRDTVIAVAGGSKRELMGKRITPELEQIMESRKIYQYTGEGQPLQVTEGIDSLLTTVAAPILAEGDLLGWCCSSPAIPLPSPATPSTSWPRPSPPFWAGTWRAESSLPRGRLYRRPRF